MPVSLCLPSLTACCGLNALNKAKIFTGLPNIAVILSGQTHCSGLAGVCQMLFALGAPEDTSQLPNWAAQLHPSCSSGQDPSHAAFHTPCLPRKGVQAGDDVLFLAPFPASCSSALMLCRAMRCSLVILAGLPLPSNPCMQRRD